MIGDKLKFYPADLGLEPGTSKPRALNLHHQTIEIIVTIIIIIIKIIHSYIRNETAINNKHEHSEEVE